MSEYFCGWYFKCQGEDGTLAFIPSVHRTPKGNFCSLQVITQAASFCASFPESAMRLETDGPGTPPQRSRQKKSLRRSAQKKSLQRSEKRKPLRRFGQKKTLRRSRQKSLTLKVLPGENIFSERGICLALHTDTVSVCGTVRFGPFTPLRYDIMGPFCLLPFMECRHSVYSMRHTVNGQLTVNGKKYRFRNGTGYLEGDRGRSFPREYLWAQTSLPCGSLMLSVAEIPLGPFRFTGIIGVVRWKGKEYRLATYLGAKAVKVSAKETVIRQGEQTLTVGLLDQKPQLLKAPMQGDMTRRIRESAACRIFCKLEQKDRTLFALERSDASMEYEYDR